MDCAGRSRSAGGDGAFWNLRDPPPLTVPIAHAKAGSPLRSAAILPIYAFGHPALWMPFLFRISGLTKLDDQTTVFPPKSG
jgi:hypothetical protein